MTLPIYIDIDGTLTNLPTRKWGKVFIERVEKIKQLVREGNEVVLWTGGGTLYARQFADKYGITGITCLGKPRAIVDDNPNIRPEGRIKKYNPESFFGKGN